MQLCKHNEQTYQDNETATQQSSEYVMCKVTEVAPLLAARVAISNLDIQISTSINEIHMLTCLCVHFGEFHYLSY